MTRYERTVSYGVDPGGLVSVITPTSDWKDSLAAWHWTAYCPEVDRMRVSGWADSYAEARREVDGVLETYRADLLK